MSEAAKGCEPCTLGNSAELWVAKPESNKDASEFLNFLGEGMVICTGLT